jgi:hypothetical protein
MKRPIGLDAAYDAVVEDAKAWKKHAGPRGRAPLGSWRPCRAAASC